MAFLTSDDLWSAIKPLLRCERPRPQGGASAGSGSCGSGRDSVRAADGDSVARTPGRTGLLRQDVLAMPGRVARGRGLGNPASSAAGASPGCRCPGLAPRGPGQREPTRKGGRGGRSQPDGPRQARHETPPRHRRAGHAARHHAERGQPERQPHARPHAGCGAGRPRQAPGAATAPAGQCACR